jgi:hypothetical protein
MKLTGFESVIGNTKPSVVDTTSATVIYEGYKSGFQYIICKIDISTPVISKTWSEGAWTDRATLTYI